FPNENPNNFVKILGIVRKTVKNLESLSRPLP
ncbi:MAG: hypothetical protein RL260_3276, partial [Pseudomonadota bacterium]